jgi:hypothetical protein
MRLGALVLGLAGCVSIPPFHGETSDASPDATPQALAIRPIAHAYHETNGMGTAGMSATGYAIPTTGIVDGDLILFIGNIDNGDENFWNLPPGFTPIANHTYGPDVQSYVVAWKIAAGEPTVYANSYRTDHTSSAGLLSLLAVTGYDPQNPIEASLKWDYPDYADPVDTSNPGIVTTVDNSLVVFVAGADWNPSNGTNTVTLPMDFTELETFGDRNISWEWSCQTIATKMQPVAGPTGGLTSMMVGISDSDHVTHIHGAGFSVVFAIAPAH